MRLNSFKRPLCFIVSRRIINYLVKLAIGQKIKLNNLNITTFQVIESADLKKYVSGKHV